VGQGKDKPSNPSQNCKIKTISPMGREMHNCKTNQFINQIMLTNQNSITHKCLITNNKSQNDIKWVLDSGATDHMTGNQILLNNYRTIDGTEYFTIANNDKVKIKGWGMIIIFEKWFLQDIFYVEKYSVNPLSISKLSRDLNCEIIFQEKYVIFQDLVTKEKIGEGQLENGLYFLDSNKLIFNSRKNDDLSKL
jgi:hypothetical protein